MEIHKFNPEDAVADAMMIALSRQYLSFSTDGVVPNLTESTRNNCIDASATVLYELYRNYPDLFTHLTLVTGFALSNNPFKKGNWNWHTFFLVRGIDNSWYSGSPANYHPVKRLSCATALIRHQRLDDTLRALKRDEGGVWPTHRFILRSIERGQYHPPDIFEGSALSHMAVTSFRVDEGGSNHALNMNTYPFGIKRRQLVFYKGAY